MPRYPIPDALRGFSLLSMAGFHLTWDLIWLFGVRFPAGSDTLLYLWQQSICWSFIFLSGFSLPFGRRPFRRGGELFCCGAAVAAVSFLLSSLELTDGPLLFGILTFLGSAAILCAGLRPLLRRISAAAGFWASLLLFAVFRGVNQGVFGFPPFFPAAPVPENWYRNLFTAFLGFPPENFYSLDYFSLFPWIFLYASGLFFHRLLKEQGRMPILARPAPRLLTFLGRRSLSFYLLHQPVIFGILFLYFSIPASK